MENILSHVSTWGIVAMIFTTLRITWSLFKAKSLYRINQLFKILTYKIKVFFFNEYKLISLLILSISILTIIHDVSPVSQANFTKDGFWLGVALMAYAILLGYIAEIIISKYTQELPKLLKLLHILFRVNSPISVGGIIVLLGGLFCLLYFKQTSIALHPYYAIEVILSVIMGASLVALSLKLWYYSMEFSPEPYKGYFMSVERLDNFLASTLGAMLTSIVTIYTFQSINGVLLVIAIAWSSLLISSIAKISIQLKLFSIKSIYVAFFKIALAFLITGITYLLINYFLPFSWIHNTREYYAKDVFYVASLGVLVALLAGKLLMAYKFIQAKQLALQNKYINNKIILGIIRLIFSMSTIFTVGSVFIFAYQKVGLFGMMITWMIMLSNVFTYIKHLKNPLYQDISSIKTPILIEAPQEQEYSSKIPMSIMQD